MAVNDPPDRREVTPILNLLEHVPDSYYPRITDHDLREELQRAQITEALFMQLDQETLPHVIEGITLIRHMHQTGGQILATDTQVFQQSHRALQDKLREYSSDVIRVQGRNYDAEAIQTLIALAQENEPKKRADHAEHVRGCCHNYIRPFMVGQDDLQRGYDIADWPRGESTEKTQAHARLKQRGLELDSLHDDNRLLYHGPLEKLVYRTSPATAPTEPTPAK